MTAPDAHPFVSIIVPVYNDAGRIGACIESLLRQKWPADRREIIIVDNNSTDKTREIIARYPVTMLVERDRQSSYAARNLGLRHAKGEVLAFTDSDARAHANWLANGIARMQRDGVDYLSCRVKMFFGTGAEPTLLDLVDYHFAFDNKIDLQHSHSTPTVALLTRPSVIKAVGGFNEELISGGDVEFGDRVWRGGFRQEYEESAIVYHPCRSTGRSFFKRTWRYGRGRLVLSRRFPARFGAPLPHLLSWRNYIPPHPRRFAARVRRRFRLSIPAVVGIFCLYYINRLCYQSAKWWALFAGTR